MVLRAVANTGVAISKIDFINKYGFISSKYPCVGPLGYPSIGVSIFLILTIVFAIGGSVLLSLKYTNNTTENTTTNNNFKNNIAPILSYICFGLAGIFLIIYLIKIFGCYIGQHGQWLTQIPQSALNQLYTTRAVETVLNATRRRK